MSNQRGIRKAVAVASAAFIAAVAFVGAPVSAAAATSTSATQEAQAFPTDYFFLKNPAQGKCVMPTTPSYVGPLTLQTCGDLDQYFFAFVWEGKSQLDALWGTTADGYGKCLVADSSNKVYTKTCKGVPTNTWQLVGKTVKNEQTGKCLSANNAGEVYMATCDDSTDRSWEFPKTATAAASRAAHAAVDARRAELAALSRRR